jgi:hypothetical protein
MNNLTDVLIQLLDEAAVDGDLPRIKLLTEAILLRQKELARAGKDFNPDDSTRKEED